MIIGVSGKKRSGKDTFFNVLHKYNSEYVNIKFADKLKKICSILTGLPSKYFYDAKNYNIYLETWGMNIRQLMQKIGTDVFRNNFDEDVWVKSFQESLNSNHIVVTDVRFLNEAEWIKKNGILIRIERNYKSFEPDNHKSEIELDNYENFDYIINNNSNVETFICNIENTLKEIGLNFGNKI